MPPTLPSLDHYSTLLSEMYYSVSSVGALYTECVNVPDRQINSQSANVFPHKQPITTTEIKSFCYGSQKLKKKNLFNGRFVSSLHLSSQTQTLFCREKVFVTQTFPVGIVWSLFGNELFIEISIFESFNFLYCFDVIKKYTSFKCQKNIFMKLLCIVFLALWLKSLFAVILKSIIRMVYFKG